MSIGLAYLASCGVVYANFLAVFMLGLQHNLHLSAQMSGTVASANLLGGALGSLVAAVGSVWLSSRRVTILSIIAVTSLDVVSVWASSAEQLLLLRALHGVAAGLLIGLAYRFIAGTTAPERALGISLVIQLAESALSLSVFPPLLPSVGLGILFLSMAILEALGLVIFMVLPIKVIIGAEEKHVVRQPGQMLSRFAVTACVALLLFQCSRFMTSGFSFNFGAYLNLSTFQVGRTLGIAGWMGGLGALTAALLGNRFTRSQVIVTAVLVRTVAFVALLACRESPVAYCLTLCIEEYFAFLALPFFFGVCLGVDRTGRLGTWSSFTSKMGLTFGPVVGGAILTTFGFPVLVCLAGVVGLCAMALVLPSARLSDYIEGCSGSFVGPSQNR
jgi:predicted MFS family arabinose efflux permease